MKSSHTDYSKYWYCFGCILILAVVSIAIYFNTLYNGFVYDDEFLILANKWIRDIRYLPDIFLSSSWSFREGNTANTYRPMQHVLMMAEYKVFGLRPWGFHLTNIIFHTINTVLVFLVASLIFKQLSGVKSQKNLTSHGSRFTVHDSLAFISALLFASHPIHTEAVAWASAVISLAMAAGYLLSFYLYITPDDTLKLRFISIISFLAAIFLRETAITLLFIMVVYDYTRDGMGFLKRRYKGYLPYLFVIAIYFGLRLYSLGGFSVKRNLPLTNYEVLINIFPLFLKYLGKLFLPIYLSAHYPMIPFYSILKWKALGAFIFTIGFGTVLFLLRKRDRIAFFSLSLIVVPLLPVFYLPGLGAAAFAERYLYIPSIGFVILVTYIGKQLYDRIIFKEMLSSQIVKRGVVFILFFTLTFYSLLTLRRNTVWYDDYTLWTDTVKKQPLSSLAHNNLGDVYQNKKLFNKAIEEYKKALKLDPDDVDTHYALAVLYINYDLLQEAMGEFHHVIRIDPDYKKVIEKIKEVASLINLRKSNSAP